MKFKSWSKKITKCFEQVFNQGNNHSCDHQNKFARAYWCEVNAVFDHNYCIKHINGLVQDCGNSSALAVELQQSWTKLIMWNICNIYHSSIHYSSKHVWSWQMIGSSLCGPDTSCQLYCHTAPHRRDTRKPNTIGLLPRYRWGTQ